MAQRELNTLELVLSCALIIALVCSLAISYYVYVKNDKHYREGFSTWQMPMIFAILADLYLMK
jgi:hypothetical protein